VLFTFSLQCCNGSKPHSWFQSLALSLAKETTPSSASLSMQGSVPCLRQFLSSHSSTLEVIKATADGYNLYNLEICIIVQTKVLERFLGRAEEKKKKFSLLLTSWLRIASRRTGCSLDCFVGAAIYFVKV